MRLKETTKKTTQPDLNKSHIHHYNNVDIDLLKTLRVSPTAQQLQQRCSSVGSTSSNSTCETERSTHSSVSAFSPTTGGSCPAAALASALAPTALTTAYVPAASQPASEAAAAVMAANIAESFTFLQQHAAHQFRDILYAAHMLGRGYYQPAGPLISPHVIAPPPTATSTGVQPQHSQPTTVTAKKLNESDEDSATTQPPATTSTTEHAGREVLLGAADLTPLRYQGQPHHPVPQQQQAQQQYHQQQAAAASAVAATAAAAAAAAAGHPGVPYPRSMHAAQMHYSTAYPPNYYTPYPGEVMCYSPPAYQPYFSTKVYQSAPPPPPPGAYRRYPYYQHGPPPPLAELYEQQQQPQPTQAQATPQQQAQPTPQQGQSPSTVGQAPVSAASSLPATGQLHTQAQPTAPAAGSQLVPAHTQHLEHYPGPPSYYAGYSPGASAAGQCYTRTIQGPYMEYPPPCPCPMQQSCPKNVHTGPHIGSNSSNNNHTSSSSSSKISPTHMTSLKTSSSSSSSNNMMPNSTSNSSSNNNLQLSGSQSNNNLAATNSSSNPNNATTTLTNSRGPVKNDKNNDDDNNNSSNNLHALDAKTATTSTSTVATTTTTISKSTTTTNNIGTQCQVLVKTEPKTETNNNNNNDHNGKSQYEAHVMQPPTPPESYCASDDKLLEEVEHRLHLADKDVKSMETLSDEKQTQTHALDIEAYDLTSSTPPPISIVAAAVGVARKARIGKNMAREMVYAAQQQQSAKCGIDIETKQQTQLQQPQEPQLPLVLKAEIKAETKIKIEHEDVVKAAATSTHINNNNNNNNHSNLLDLKLTIKTEPNQPDACCDLLTSNSLNAAEPSGSNKQRIKILDPKAQQNKKSPAHSYKSLIKQAEPKNYLCLSRKYGRRYGRAPAKYIKRRHLVITERQKQRLRAQRRRQLEQRKLQACEQAELQTSVGHSEVQLEAGTAKAAVTPSGSPKRNKPRKQTIAALHLLESIDTVARGYFSDPELNSSRSQAHNLYAPSTPSPLTLSKPRVAPKTKQTKQTTEKRSKSETKRPLPTTASTSPSTCGSSKASAISTHMRNVEAVALTHVEQTTSDAVTEPPAKKLRKLTIPRARVKAKPRKQTAKSPKAAVSTVVTTEATTTSASTVATAVATIPTAAHGHTETNNNEYLTADLQAQKLMQTVTSDSSTSKESVQETQSQASAELLQQLQTQHNDEPKQQQFVVPSLPELTTETATATTTVPAAPTTTRQVQSHTHAKRTRSRSKFGNRKRQRQRHGGVSYELDETQPPATRANVVPKWNNGWMWSGRPFQGAVFLNSDDPLVLRTCYSAMQHVEGDIIRTRDCVLLKANDDNELPYVAKVAHLWQNPEDGEMMMSLLWYYRPEHTDQGRQRNDCPDEVYASRHRDHNSVACIEDKCYVLTFSEYCRYRRRLRAAEEDVEDISIVPRRSNTSNCYAVRTVPDQTNPELVMFCRRAYEFRTRRLLKLPHKNGLISS